MNPKQISCLAALLDRGVEFAVVGGVAVVAHGYVHATSDLDVFMRPTPANAQLALEALGRLGYPVETLQPDDLLREDSHVRFGPKHNCIDILPSIGAMPFDQVWRNREDARVGRILIPFISRDDLIANKRQVGRHGDLADVEELTSLDSTL